MPTPAFRGIYAAFPTPVDASDAVNETTLRKMIRFLVSSGCEGLVPIGGTGEFTALSPQERLRAVEITVDEAAGRVPVIAGVLSPGLAEAVDAGRAYRAAGVDALLVLAPFYVRPTQAAIRSYFTTYRDRVDAPILFYDIPGKTGVVTASQTIVQMASDKSIVGMKACSVDPHHFNAIITRTDKDFSGMSGEDTLYPLHAAMGASGGILATASILPEYWVQIYKLVQAGDFKGAVAAQQLLVPFLDAVFSEVNPGPLKYAIETMGLAFGDTLLPLLPPSSETRANVDLALADLRQQGVLKAFRDPVSSAA
jgi:4-hydroxy-tetrahydrodipicolinate synthase